MIHVLHLCSDYAKQKLYKEFFLALSENEIYQTVYVPVRSAEEVGKYEIQGVPNLEIIYAHVLKPWHRVFYKSKIDTIFKDVVSRVDFKKVDLIHAHFLFSDGGVALRLKRKFSIPYFTAVRNTDVNVFFKYMLHLRHQGCQILSGAERLIFVTPAYRKLLVEKFTPDFLTNRILNAAVIPNGLASFWFDGQVPKLLPHIPLRVLYVGDFTTNKNILLLLDTLRIFSKECPVSLTLAGGGGDGHASVENALKRKEYDFAKYIGKIDGIENMKTLYKEHDMFIMISKLETFGLVYLEALSQGLPVIHTAGQGIDGYFEKGNFAIPVNPKNLKECILAIHKVVNNFETASYGAILATKTFSWPEIAGTYVKLYFETAINEKN